LNEQKTEHQPSTGSEETRAGGYIAPLIAIAFTVLWPLAFYWLIGDRPRDWQYGTVRYVPAQSLASSVAYPSGPTPKQVILPEPDTGGGNAPR
jgi:hypothetical protein